MGNTKHSASTTPKHFKQHTQPALPPTNTSSTWAAAETLAALAPTALALLALALATNKLFTNTIPWHDQQRLDNIPHGVPDTRKTEHAVKAASEQGDGMDCY